MTNLYKLVGLLVLVTLTLTLEIDSRHTHQLVTASAQTKTAVNLPKTNLPLKKTTPPASPKAATNLGTKVNVPHVGDREIS